jgi:hypothetical protein
MQSIDCDFCKSLETAKNNLLTKQKLKKVRRIPNDA